MERQSLSHNRRPFVRNRKARATANTFRRKCPTIRQSRPPGPYTPPPSTFPAHTRPNSFECWPDALRRHTLCKEAPPDPLQRNTAKRPSRSLLLERSPDCPILLSATIPIPARDPLTLKTRKVHT